MHIYQLTDKNIFPDPAFANPDGLLAMGGDLSVQRIITAYSLGIFPWYSEEQPILWWSPNPRMVLFPNKFIRHKNLVKTVKSDKFQISFDTMFEDVIEFCSSIPRKHQDGETWITEEMKKGYINLHKIGTAHSVEVSFKGKLVGGLYGLSIGGCFFGESMFHLVTDASKVALYHLVDRLLLWNFDLIDVQQETEHLKSLGATSIDRKEFLHLLKNSVKKEGKFGSWNLPIIKN